ncbi:hypothetical protein K1T71_010080 [Dendrolimus kikuchii]|uniref:Uncharacterized protein n=1 Tax=Dendrolimus kikuchii TaxID=765133 RepID=A0ACC1CRA7_9NEOP|nr:hypothetical protein K1T71_010080 [Dendrolimus kikuchii]
MDLNTLIVLMWKHLVVRVRRFIHTPIEILSPTLLFILTFLLFKELRGPAFSHHDGGSVKMTEPLPLTRVYRLHDIFYYPNTSITRSLMEAVKEKSVSRQYTAVENLTKVNELAKDMSDQDALVIFKDMDGATLPNKLNYTIRMTKYFRTDSYEPEDMQLKPRSSYGETYEQFMRLQWALDTSYIKILTGNVVNVTVTLQEFPYYNNNDDNTMSTKCTLLQVACFLGMMLPYIFLMSRLLEERSTGIQELIKMVGVSPMTLGISHFLNVLPTGLSYAIIGAVLSKVGEVPLLPQSNGFLIFVMMILHFATVVSFAFVSSYLVKSTQYVVTVSLFSYLILWLPIRLLNLVTLRSGTLILTGLLPHAPMYWFWDEVSALESYSDGLTISKIFTSHTEGSGPVLYGFVFMIAQIIIFSFLAWYLSMVRPGKYGQAMPWNFIFSTQYWRKNEIDPYNMLAEEEGMKPYTDPRYFESAPLNLDVGIRVVDVSKVFDKQKALDGVSLDVYKGEITVLLGHNGAGKTTLISIITGMMGATNGNVYVNGLDLSRQRQEVRKNLGLCPQHNLYFPDLTVLEHLKFFALLKGSSFKDANESSLALLDKLGLRAKAQCKGAELSGGMKRRLQLACALSGGASVLILDEPTSGLDVETRRELWDLLLSLRGDRTVLLTTHFMEEADALGDRVAALHAGTLRCHATTMFLKKAIGTGYRLTLTTIGMPNTEGISKAITSKLPQASLTEQSVNSICFSLPAANCQKFASLFNYLESKRPELGINSIGVGVSTLEEVFLKLCSDIDTNFSEDEIDSALPAPKFKKVSGIKLYLRQSRVLIHRQFKYITSKKLAFFLMGFVLPVLTICVMIKSIADPSYGDEGNSIAMNLNLYDGRTDKRVLYNADEQNMRVLKDKYAGVHFEKADDVVKDILEIGKRNVIDYNKYLVGIELNETNAKVLYTTTIRHAAPVALNLLSNVIATWFIPSADGGTLETRNQPVNHYIASVYEEPKTRTEIMMLMAIICGVIMATLINFVSLPCKERASGARHAHIMSGCPGILYWTLTLIYNVLITTVLLFLPTLIALFLLDDKGTFVHYKFVFAMLYVLVMGSMAFFAMMYLISLHFSERSAGVVLIAIVFVTGLITPTIHDVDIATKVFDNVTFRWSMTIIGMVVPAHAFTMGAITVGYISRLNTFCDMNRDMCPNLISSEDYLYFNKEKCCRNEDANCYFCFADGNYEVGAAKWMITLACQFLVYWALIILTESGFFNRVCDKIVNCRYRVISFLRDETVRAENEYVKRAIELPKKQISDAMLVREVHKNYFSLFRKSCNAVKGVSFSVKKGECFGLLGVNGAGKSTTFKMMTAEDCTTRGEITANARRMHKEREAYMRTLGYCPQFFGLDQFLTGRENLSLVLTLRGFDEDVVKSEVKSWMEVVGLEKYADRLVSEYSGGCTRRLGSAAALACGAPLTLLDEPTAGVDVSARRRVWKALRRGLKEHRAVVITSHSMDEMEALCSRIAIMSQGALVALGSAATLRANHAAGHAVVFKIRHYANADEVDNANSEVTRLKEKVHTHFHCTLKDEHKTMLHYHINETMRYSDLFEALESLKETFPSLIEDYSVTETTLEEVFLSFAKENQEIV